jgi:hypothetical protein
MSDPVVDWLKKKGHAVTRKNYLNVAYMGAPPAELTAEQESELPEELQNLGKAETDALKPAKDETVKDIRPKT